MKQKDILTVVVIGIISAVLSFVLSGKIFAPPKLRSQKVEVAPSISSSFPSADSQYFNTKSIDPTPTITIHPNNNTNPFGNTTTPN